jgi:hypothetical protein
MPFGILDTSYIDFPPGVDVNYLQALQTRSGVDFARVIRELESRLAAANSTADPLVAMLARITSEPFADTSAAANFKARKHSQYTPPRPQFNDSTGVMLPIDKWDVSFQFTEDGLEDMSLDKIIQQIEGAIGGMKQSQRIEAITRLFSIAEVRVDRNTVVTSPGFAGSGTGTNVFSSPYPNGVATAANYTLYSRVASAGLDAEIKRVTTELKKWNTGPFEAIGGQAMIDLVSALPGFVKTGSDLVKAGSGTAEAQLDPKLYVGVLNGEIKVQVPLTETNDLNLSIFKTFGNFDARNPLALRYDPLTGRNMVAHYRALYPLDMAVLLQKWGFGVNSRVGAANIFVAGAGNYTDPTITG